MFKYSIIPLPYYTPIFYNLLLIIILAVFLKVQSKIQTVSNSKREDYSLFLMLVITFYIGLRPISGQYFGDMGTYSVSFEKYSLGTEIESNKDVLWHIFMKFSSGIMSVKMFFLLCAFLYIVPIYLACKKWLKQNKYILFLMFVASFSFWAYGVNGIRNGIATSFFLLAISYNKNRYIRFSFLLISYLFHGSLIIPIVAYLLTQFIKKPKYYLIIWLLSIPISLISGGFWESILLSFGFEEERLIYLTDNTFDDSFTSTGFRWDFVLYSASAIYAGYYFILKKKFTDKIYNILFGIYAIANAFWILVIKASFSNRFAYLSWFIMAVVIFYPFFKAQFFKNQPKVLARTIILYFCFTYFMFLIT